MGPGYNFNLYDLDPSLQKEPHEDARGRGRARLRSPPSETVVSRMPLPGLPQPAQNRTPADAHPGTADGTPAPKPTPRHSRMDSACDHIRPHPRGLSHIPTADQLPSSFILTKDHRTKPASAIDLAMRHLSASRNAGTQDVT